MAAAPSSSVVATTPTTWPLSPIMPSTNTARPRVVVVRIDVLELTTITQSMHKHKPSFDDSCRLFVVTKRNRADDKHGRKAGAQPLWGSISNFCTDITRTTDAPGLEFEGVRLRLHGGYFNECFIESAATPRMCEVCGEDKCINSFPNATQVSSHDHEHDVCHECFAMHLDVEVDSKMWDQISCPQCPSLLQQHEIQNLATPECFAKYARFARRAALSSNPDYRYCFSTSCESGQVYEGQEPVFSCQECGHRHCTVCEVDWHKDETCEQYQARNQVQKGYEAESEATLQATSKPCPNCQARIVKSDGCDHMLCSQCQHQFCWACLADFIPIARHGLHNHHPDCPNHRPAGDINEDMIAHANAMLLMANGRFQEMLEEIFGFRLQ